VRYFQWRCTSLLATAFAVLLLYASPSQAVPNFAMQTGQPCVMCHVGGFGPQLTPFGRAFKIGGYTQDGGTGWEQYMRVSAFLQGSLTTTQTGWPQGQQPQHYNTNNNFALDQISIFIAGRVTEHTGGFIQLTWSDIGNNAFWDNTDLRPYTTEIDIGDHELRVGTTVNSGPTVQDPYNTTYAWEYPYFLSSLAPRPTADPSIYGFLGNSVGVTGYAWYDRSLYVEAGGYSTRSTWNLARTGDPLGPGSTQGTAPYLRVAYEWDWNDQAAYIGGMYFQSNVNPTTDEFSSSGAFGRDHYRDYAFDLGYQYIGSGAHRLNLMGIITYEQQNLEGTTASYNAANPGTAYGPNTNLTKSNVTASYWYQNTYGLTFNWEKWWGSYSPVLYQNGEAVTGSANGKPNSNAFVFEADWVPFGKEDSWLRPWANLKIGLQYTLWTQFNGGSSNYDGYGRNASGNNTIFLYAWTAF
jgi:hypothetical protein